MSIHVMNLVWENSPYEGNTLLTMLALADRSDDEGSCFPSVETLAKKTRQTERNVQRCLKKMADEGYLDRQFRIYNSTIYRLNLSKLKGDKLSPPPTPKGDRLGSTRVTNGAKTMSQMSPDSSSNTSVDSKPLLFEDSKEEPKDRRGSVFSETHKRLYMAKNNCPPSEVPWGKKEAGHLKWLLGEKPGWGEKFIVHCLENRFKSEVNHRQGPMKYMDDLNDYASGPLNAYGKPLARAREEAPLHHAGDL